MGETFTTAPFAEPLRIGSIGRGDGEGAGAGGPARDGGQGGHAGPDVARILTVDERGVQAAVGRDVHRLHLAVGGVVQDEYLAHAVDAIEDAAGRAARVDVAATVHGHGRDVALGTREKDLRLVLRGDAVDPSLRSGGHEQAPLVVEREGPDVLVRGIEVDLGLAGAVDGVHLAVGRGAGVETAVLADGEGMDLELRGVEEEGGLAVLDAEHLAVVAGADVEAAVRVAGERPDVGRLRVLDHAGGRSQTHTALGVDRESLRLPVEEIARPFELPELGLGGLDGGGDGEASHGQQPRGEMAHRTSQ